LCWRRRFGFAGARPGRQKISTTTAGIITVEICKWGGNSFSLVKVTGGYWAGANTLNAGFQHATHV